MVNEPQPVAFCSGGNLKDPKFLTAKGPYCEKEFSSLRIPRVKIFSCANSRNSAAAVFHKLERPHYGNQVAKGVKTFWEVQPALRPEKNINVKFEYRTGKCFKEKYLGD